jgi:alkaline phosphatase
VNEWGRPDGRNLIEEAASRGYTVLRTRDDLGKLSTWRTRQVFGIFAPGDFYFSSLQTEPREQPSLAEMTRAAISSLNYNINGYFLVVTHGLIARASEQNLGKLAVNEVAEVDEAIQSAVEYAGPDALVMVTNSYSLGAIGPVPAAWTSEAHPALTNAATSVPPAPVPAVPPAWLSGPGGPPATKAQEDWLRDRYDTGSFSTNAPGLLAPQPAFRFAAQAVPLGEPAWLASRGDGSAQLRGFFNNTDVFEIVNEQF